jgi:hypothetical protein
MPALHLHSLAVRFETISLLPLCERSRHALSENGGKPPRSKALPAERQTNARARAWTEDDGARGLLLKRNDAKRTRRVASGARRRRIGWSGEGDGERGSGEERGPNRRRCRMHHRPGLGHEWIVRKPGRVEGGSRSRRGGQATAPFPLAASLLLQRTGSAALHPLATRHPRWHRQRGRHWQEEGREQQRCKDVAHGGIVQRANEGPSSRARGFGWV